METKLGYEQLPHEDIGMNVTRPKSLAQGSTPITISARIGTIVFVILFTMIIVSTTIVTVIAERKEDLHGGWTSCGRSPAEAKSRGCIFDIMNTAWTPADCYDHELTEMYLKNGKFRYWTTQDQAAVEIPEHEVRLGEYTTLYTQFRYHIMHCQFIWMKQVRALSAEKPFDSQSILTEHSEHCLHMLTNVDWQSCIQNDRNESINVGYLGCGKGKIIPEDALTFTAHRYATVEVHS